MEGFMNLDEMLQQSGISGGAAAELKDVKSGFVTLIGRPNVGKSTLMNHLIGQKIAITSNKPQTTRNKIQTVYTDERGQIVFLDTPGIHKSKNKLSEHMDNVVRDSVSEIDAVIFVADVSKNIFEHEKELIEGYKLSKAPVILALNKIDLVSKENLAEQIRKYSEIYDFKSIIPISVINKDGIDLVMNEISKYASEGPHFFPDEMFTDQPERVIAAEIIREKFLILLNEAVPHGIAVTVEEMKERDDKDLLDNTANIFCERDSHKGIIIGKNGAMLKKAGSMAREELESFFQIKVNLQCWVKVKQDWRNKEGMIKNFGLDSRK